MILNLYKKVFSYVERNQRHISTLVFLGGFVGDLLTFTLLDPSVVNALFLAYLGVAFIGTFLTHTTEARGSDSPYRIQKILSVVAPLATQFSIGGLLSGCLIFYTKSSTLAVSWPFLLLLFLVFLGNEYFRSYRSHLVFQTGLFFFGLYSYVIFALPLYVGKIGPAYFLLSTTVSIAVFSAFLTMLWFAGKERLSDTLRQIVLACAGTVVLVVGAYFTGLVPPIPLTLQDGGIYQSLTRVPGGYVVEGEKKSHWWTFKKEVIHHVSGTPLFAYSAVFAPGAFTTTVVHHWEKYDEAQGVWVNKGKITFPLSGGRHGGYRGYSEISAISPGTWRVSIETSDGGQVIGRINFIVVEVDVPPTLETFTL